MNSDLFELMSRYLDNKRIVCEGQIIPCSEKYRKLKKYAIPLHVLCIIWFLYEIILFFTTRTQNSKICAIVSTFSMIILVIDHLVSPPRDAYLIIECQQQGKNINIPKGTTFTSSKGHVILTVEKSKHSLSDRLKYFFRKTKLPGVYVIPVKFLKD